MLDVGWSHGATTTTGAAAITFYLLFHGPVLWAAHANTAASSPAAARDFGMFVRQQQMAPNTTQRLANSLDDPACTKCAPQREPPGGKSIEAARRRNQGATSASRL